MAATKISCLLKEKRNTLGMTPQEVIAALKEHGIEIKEKALYAYENGDNAPKVNTFLALCDIYKISDIMGEFGYSKEGCTVPLATGDNEWHIDMYNDFFNGSPLEKLYLIMKNGLPSFDGYEEELKKCFPSSAETANLNKLYHYFINLDEHAQGVALENMKTLSEAQYPTISDNDLLHISKTTNTSVKVLQNIAVVLEKLNAEGLEMVLDLIGFLAGCKRFQKKDSSNSRATG